MLKECFSPGSPEQSDRRWFSDDYFDLIVWIDEKGAVSGFQLCYDKLDKERALTWTSDAGYAHERVDDGEANPTKNRTPILVPDGICPTKTIIELFLERSAEVDPELRSFVVDKLRNYQNDRATS